MDPVRTVAPFTHNGSINMSRGAPRPSIINKATSPNEKRFGLNDYFDKSTFLTKVPRPKLNMTF